MGYIGHIRCRINGYIGMSRVERCLGYIGFRVNEVLVVVWLDLSPVTRTKMEYGVCRVLYV